MKRNIIAPLVISLVVVGASVGAYTFLSKASQITSVIGHAALPQLKKSELIKSSTVIVLARIKEVQSGKYPSKFREGEEDIISTATLEIEKYLYNPENIATQTLSVQTLGGTVGDTNMIVEGSPSFKVGDHTLAFLIKDPSGVFTVNGWAQGKYTIDVSGEIGVGEEELAHLHNIFGTSRLVSGIESEIKSVAMLPAVTSVKAPTNLGLPSKNANTEAQSVLDAAAVR